VSDAHKRFVVQLEGLMPVSACNSENFSERRTILRSASIRDNARKTYSTSASDNLPRISLACSDSAPESLPIFV
jgi:hypothetical protein